jgi:hypothetical protein
MQVADRTNRVNGGVYSAPAYAACQRGLGDPVELERCGGWVLRRPIPGSDLEDAMGCYPLFACRAWDRLGEDVEGLRDRLVSLTLVSDPFAEFDPTSLGRTFDVVRPFKTHFVADLNLAPERIASAHHRYEARRGLRRVEVDVCWRPRAHVDDWVDLYAQLVAYRGLNGPHALSAASFAQLFELDDVVLLRAIAGGVTVGAQILILQGDVAHAHLAAFAPAGYRLGASYALDWMAVESMRDRARWLNWGGQAGLEENPDDGLARYKRGWATHTRRAWLLGAILDPVAYAELCGGGAASQTYFPAYRSGEFRRVDPGMGGGG